MKGIEDTKLMYYKNKWISSVKNKTQNIVKMGKIIELKIITRIKIKSI